MPHSCEECILWRGRGGCASFLGSAGPASRHYSGGVPLAALAAAYLPPCCVGRSFSRESVRACNGFMEVIYRGRRSASYIPAATWCAECNAPGVVCALNTFPRMQSTVVFACLHLGKKMYLCTVYRHVYYNPVQPEGMMRCCLCVCVFVDGWMRAKSIHTHTCVNNYTHVCMTFSHAKW